MKYDFDEIIDRKGTGSVRWDMARKKYGEPDLIPLTTADMDFRAAKPVCGAIRDAADFGIFGYTQPKDSYYEAVQQRLKEKWHWDVKREWITYSAGIVGAIAFCVQGMTEPGDAIAIMTPVYHPFAHIIEDNGRRPVHTCLIQKEGEQPQIDFADLEKVIAENQVKMLIFCNPHNPIGRVWKKEEIDKICSLCVKYGVILISDEIHSDFIFSGYQFCSAGPAMEEAGGLEQLVVCTAASKSFNIAGLQCSGIIIPGEELRGKYRKMLMNQHFMEMNLIGPLATEAGYRYGGEWLEQVCAYLEETRDFMVDYLKETIPQIKPVVPEATYMMWLDCRGLGMSEPQLEEFLVHDAKVALNMGSTFGEGGEGFVRINFGSPKAVIKEALDRICHALEKKKN